MLSLAVACCLLAAPPADPSWLDGIDEADRSCLQRGVGFAPPPFPADLQWFNGPPLQWDDLRGKVVMVQSWSSASERGRGWLARAANVGAAREDLVVLALHTPEGAPGAGAYLDRHEVRLPVVVDPGGAFCDTLGVYRQPTNLLIDRNGVVRYAGLSPRGIDQAVAALLEEPADPDAVAPPRPADAPAPAPPSFPAPTGGVRGAMDLRGKAAPDFSRISYLNGRPDAAGKVVVVDLWATWCGPCRMSIPHLNALADQFRDGAVFVGLSDESPADFHKGLDKHHLSMNSFRYPLALDPGGAVGRSIRLSGIPQTMVISSDGVVRWQGHPEQLRPGTLRAIIEANRGEAVTRPTCLRWTG